TLTATIPPSALTSPPGSSTLVPYTTLFRSEPQPLCQTAFATHIGKFALADGSWIQDFPEPARYSSPLFVTVNPAEERTGIARRRSEEHMIELQLRDQCRCSVWIERKSREDS